jgi:uncharacterized membrane protein
VKYLILPENALKNKLTIDYPREKSKIKSYDPKKISSLVLRLQFPKDCCDKNSETYLLPEYPPITINVEIYNFGLSQFLGKLELQFPEGWKGTLDNDEISVSPMGQVSRKLEIAPSEKANSEPHQIRVNLMNSSGKAETFILAYLTPKRCSGE